MFRRNFSTPSKADSRPVDRRRRPSGGGPSRSTILLPLLVVVVAFNLAVVAAATADKAGPFRSRGRAASGNLVGGYLAAMERNHHRRFTRTDVDVLFRKLGDDFRPDLMSVDRPPTNLTRTVSECFLLEQSCKYSRSKGQLSTRSSAYADKPARRDLRCIIETVGLRSK